MTTSAPTFLPSSLRTIQARGTVPFSSSDLRRGITPATRASATSPWCSVSSTSSIWREILGCYNSRCFERILDSAHDATRRNGLVTTDHQTEVFKSANKKPPLSSTRAISPVRTLPSTKVPRVACSLFQYPKATRSLRSPDVQFARLIDICFRLLFSEDTHFLNPTCEYLFHLR